MICSYLSFLFAAVHLLLFCALNVNWWDEKWIAFLSLQTIYSQESAAADIIDVLNAAPSTSVPNIIHNSQSAPPTSQLGQLLPLISTPHQVPSLRFIPAPCPLGIFRIWSTWPHRLFLRHPFQARAASSPYSKGDWLLIWCNRLACSAILVASTTTWPGCSPMLVCWIPQF